MVLLKHPFQDAQGGCLLESLVRGILFSRQASAPSSSHAVAISNFRQHQLMKGRPACLCIRKLH